MNQNGENYRRRRRSIRSSNGNWRDGVSISTRISVTGERRKSGRRRSAVTEIEIVVIVIIVNGLRRHNASKTLRGGFSGDVLSAFDGGETGGSRTEPWLRMRRRHHRRRWAGAAWIAAPLPRVDWTLGSSPVHDCEEFMWRILRRLWWIFSERDFLEKIKGKFVEKRWKVYSVWIVCWNVGQNDAASLCNNWVRGREKTNVYSERLPKPCNVLFYSEIITTNHFFFTNIKKRESFILAASTWIFYQSFNHECVMTSCNNIKILK